MTSTASAARSAWLVNTAASAVIGLIVGFAVLFGIQRLPFGGHDTPAHTDATAH